MEVIMPDAAVHASFGRDVFSSLSPEIQSVIHPDPWTFGLFGPDLWFLYKPWRRREGRGRQMHTTRPGAFLTALLERAKVSPRREELFSWLAGFFCHYALDSITHPYIIYATTEEYHYPRCHMSFEHELDMRQIRRDGIRETKHPVTDHYLLRVSLPPSVREDVDAVFEQVYGWKDGWKAFNRSARRYRACYRLLENPSGFAARLARFTKHPLLRSFAYSESHFRDTDVENTEHRTWRHSHDKSLFFTDSLPELREKARLLAVNLIESSYRYLWQNQGTAEELSALIGNASYLSGLPADDPRNHNVKSLLPSGSKSGKK
jgi:hypothetical protein